jgi:hypothetical protein
MSPIGQARIHLSKSLLRDGRRVTIGPPTRFRGIGGKIPQVAASRKMPGQIESTDGAWELPGADDGGDAESARGGGEPSAGDHLRPRGNRELVTGAGWNRVMQCDGEVRRESGAMAA